MRHPADLPRIRRACPVGPRNTRAPAPGPDMTNQPLETF
jgi:hypothetical protein